MGSELSTTAERGSTSGLNSEGSVPAEGSGKKIDPGIPLPGELDFNMWTSTGSAPKPDSGPAQHPYGARIRVDDLGVPINTDTQVCLVFGSLIILKADLEYRNERTTCTCKRTAVRICR